MGLELTDSRRVIDALLNLGTVASRLGSLNPSNSPLVDCFGPRWGAIDSPPRPAVDLEDL